jgi:hypothetical protein
VGAWQRDSSGSVNERADILPELPLDLRRTVLLSTMDHVVKGVRVLQVRRERATLPLVGVEIAICGWDPRRVTALSVANACMLPLHVLDTACPPPTVDTLQAHATSWEHKAAVADLLWKMMYLSIPAGVRASRCASRDSRQRPLFPDEFEGTDVHDSSPSRS